MLSLFLKMWHTLKKIGIFTFCMLITQLIKAPLRYSQLKNIEIINLKLVLCLPLILIDGANTVDFAKSSVLKDMLFWFFCFSTQKKWRQNSNRPNTKTYIQFIVPHSFIILKNSHHHLPIEGSNIFWNSLQLGF
jgi:hypothetical protein